MKINVEEFRKIVHASTANYLISSLHLNFTPGFVSSAMKSNEGLVSKINVKNLVLEDMVKPDHQVDMYFNDIKTTILPYLALLKDETMNIRIIENGIVLSDNKRNIKLLFCDSSIVNIATKTNPKIKFNIKLPFDDIEDAYTDIKKIAARFGKIYIGGEDNELYMETKDGTNYSNSLKADIGKYDGEDFEACFDYKMFHSVFTSLGDGEGFTFNMVYIKDRDAGMILWEKKEGDESKEYFMVSKSE
jgi:hypothetical protein